MAPVQWSQSVNTDGAKSFNLTQLVLRSNTVSSSKVQREYRVNAVYLAISGPTD